MMKQETYNSILSVIQGHKGLTIHCYELLKQKFPHINSGTLNSILSLDYQQQMKTNFIKTDFAANKLFEEYEELKRSNPSPGIILKMSEEMRISPCLIAKLILTRYLESLGYSEPNMSTHINKHIRDTTLIKDRHLAYEIYLCTIYDDQYSPLVETMKSSLGQQYEIKLYRQIKELNIAYRDEDYLRELGYDKTPDVKLEIPIAVDGFIIHWIESKALFGDYEVHKEYIKNQYSSYWNRFGSGLIIYWFGFVENIISPYDKRFIIRDHLPKNVVTL